MSPEIKEIDTSSAPETTLRALHDLYLEWVSGRVPGDPPIPWEQREAQWRHLREQEDVRRWVALDGDEIVGTSGIYHHRTQDLDNTWAWVFVRPRLRRKGIGAELARPTVRYSLGDERKRFAVGVTKGSDVAALAERAGLTPAYNERVSQLRIADLDIDLMKEWIERSRERASDYELLFLPMPVPQEHRPRILQVMDVMNNAPLEDFEEDPMTWDDAMLADIEEMEVRRGRYLHTCVARHSGTGDFAGFTSLVYQSLHPEMAYQWDTGVDPAHQNKGLGRWLKAAMILRFMDEHPDVELIETQNAESNEPMLNINNAMGFKPAHEEVIHQGPTEAVARFLGIG